MMMPITFRNAWAAVVAALVLLVPAAVAAQLPDAPAGAPAAAHAGAQAHAPGGEANLVLPDLSQVRFTSLGDLDGHTLLSLGLIVTLAGFAFGLVIYFQLQRLPVHRSMREISELIYETCKTYLITQGKFILLLELFIGAVIVLYFGVLLQFTAVKVAIILAFSLIGIAGSYGVAWFGIRINTFANSRTAFASLEGKPFPLYAIPLKAGHEHRHAAHLGRAVPDALHPAVRAGRLRRRRASSASPSASRSAPRRCASPAASSPRSPTSAPI